MSAVMSKCPCGGTGKQPAVRFMSAETRAAFVAVGGCFDLVACPDCTRGRVSLAPSAAGRVALAQAGQVYIHNQGCSACGWSKQPCFFANCMHPDGPRD